MAELSTATISQIERGKQGYSIKSLGQLAKALDAEPGWLLSRNPADNGDAWGWAEIIAALPPTERARVENVLAAVLGRAVKESE